MTPAVSAAETLIAPKPASSQGVGAGAPAYILAALDEASQATGVSFSYLVNKASTESGFRPDAKARTSSATGLYQFIDRTWLDMVDRYGAKYGLGDEAAAITRQQDGSFTVSGNKKAILELRKDPRLSALMAAEYAGENKRYLEKALGRPVGDTDLYLAHFLGAGGAENFLRGLDRNPGAAAASFVPTAAAANKSVFYDRSGHARSLQAVYDRFAARFESAPAATPPTQVAESAPLPKVKPLRDFNTAMPVALAANTVGDAPGLAGAVSSLDALAGVRTSSPFLTSLLLASLELPGAEALGGPDAYKTSAREAKGLLSLLS